LVTLEAWLNINIKVNKKVIMPKNSNADESILNPATSKGKSLRTTIPAFIVSQFDLKQGDRLKWSIQDGWFAVDFIRNSKDQPENKQQ
jgi:hypothetical protein